MDGGMSLQQIRALRKSHEAGDWHFIACPTDGIGKRRGAMFSACSASYMEQPPAPRWPGDTDAQRAADVAMYQAEAIGWASR